MPIFTVHIDTAGPEPGLNAEQMVLVPEKFNFWAFGFGPLWLVWNRLWLALTGWILFIAILVTTSLLLSVPASAVLLIYYASVFLIALEANQLRRRRLEKQGLKLVDITGGRDVEDAERRFLTRGIPLSPTEAAQRYTPNHNTLANRSNPSADQIGGLFQAGEQS